MTKPPRQPIVNTEPRKSNNFMLARSPTKSQKKVSAKGKLIQDQEKKAPSKYMLMIFAMNFRELVNKYDKLQLKKRVQALTLMKKTLAKKFMKVYRMYRFKKFGEPLS